jgi:hypothetical protein
MWSWRTISRLSYLILRAFEETPNHSAIAKKLRILDLERPEAVARMRARESDGYGRYTEVLVE